jgi:DNA-binding transcriptional ArsR family regulator
MMKAFRSEYIQKLAEQQAKLCKVFSNPQRVLILWLLMDRERTFSEIAEEIGASRPRTSQHLLLMRRSNLLESRREQGNTYYRLTDNELLQNWPVLVSLPKDQLMEVGPHT